jgi:hypothetical protein
MDPVPREGRLYDDGRIACDDDGLTVRWYYPWGSKRIPYRSIRSFRTFSLSASTGKLRIWGSGDFTHWWNLDGRRPRKETAIELDTGGRILACISPDDADAVARVLQEHVSSS